MFQYHQQWDIFTLSIRIQTFAILLTLAEVGVGGGGGVSGLTAISSSGAMSGFSANILSKSICYKVETLAMYFNISFLHH